MWLAGKSSWFSIVLKDLLLKHHFSTGIYQPASIDDTGKTNSGPAAGQTSVPQRPVSKPASVPLCCVRMLVVPQTMRVDRSIYICTVSWLQTNFF